MKPFSSPVFFRADELQEFEYHLTKKKLMLNSSYDIEPQKELPKLALKFVFYAFLLTLLVIGLETQDKMGYERLILQIISGFFVLVHLRNAYYAYKLKVVTDEDKYLYYTDLKEDIIESSEFSDFLRLRASRLEHYKLSEDVASYVNHLDDENKLLKEVLKKKNHQD